MITRVTITGADNNVNPNDLLGLSKQFPFVEWGFLVTSKRSGTARYPTDEWVRTAMRALLPKHRAALHLCGLEARCAMRGFVWLGCFEASRVQINGYRPGINMLTHSGIRFILQCRYEDDLPQCTADAAKMEADVLFDPSGGRGIDPVGWPKTPAGCRLGFAGGIGPDNVLTQLDTIGERDGDFWIDMESGVRTNDAFDLSKVKRVLELVAPRVAATLQKMR